MTTKSAVINQQNSNPFIAMIGNLKLVVLGMLLWFNPGASAQAADVKFDVNDVSFLWPVPTNAAQVDALISMKEADGLELWPVNVFNKVLLAAQALQITSSSGRVSQIEFPDPVAFNKQSTWKVVGVRINPASLGAHAQQIETFGEAPSVRLIVQPVTKNADGTAQVHDFAAHVVFPFIVNAPGQPQPDQPAFRAIIEDLKALKTMVEASHPPTVENRRLGIHPGFTAKVPGFREKLKAFLKQHLIASRLGVVSFMGIEEPEPWIFFSMIKGPDGAFALRPNSQMFNFRGGDKIVPAPVLNQQTGEGISTAPLFIPGINARLNNLLFPATTNEALKKLNLRDIPDHIANPAFHNTRNTDCVSCHTETIRRNDLNLTPSDPSTRFQLPEGISGINPTLLPIDSWNIRNFGWFPDSSSTASETISVRAANEAAESADFINRKYLAADASAPVPVPTPEPMVSRALTLVMDIKDKANFEQLKKKLTEMQNLPPAQNPSRVALDRLGLVHFARFVFIGEDKVAVITAFDGSFERYVGAFVNELGPVFDTLLQHVKDAPKLPVREHQEEFLKYVQAHDLKIVGPFYSAYPQLTTQDILALQKAANPPIPTE